MLGRASVKLAAIYVRSQEKIWTSPVSKKEKKSKKKMFVSFSWRMLACQFNGQQKTSGGYIHTVKSATLDEQLSTELLMFQRLSGSEVMCLVS